MASEIHQNWGKNCNISKSSKRLPKKGNPFIGHLLEALFTDLNLETWKRTLDFWWLLLESAAHDSAVLQRTITIQAAIYWELETFSDLFRMSRPPLFSVFHIVCDDSPNTMRPLFFFSFACFKALSDCEIWAPAAQPAVQQSTWSWAILLENGSAEKHFEHHRI